MEVKEAIDEVYQVFYMKYGKFGNQKADDIISLLQQGEVLKAENVELKAYKQIVEEFKNIFYTNPHNWVTKEYYADEIKRLEQKYFPKEAKQDEADTK